MCQEVKLAKEYTLPFTLREEHRQTLLLDEWTFLYCKIGSDADNSFKPILYMDGIPCNQKNW